MQRGGSDEVVDGFGLWQVNPAVQKGAQCELTGFGKPCTMAERHDYRVAQDDGRAMAGYLNTSSAV